MSKEKKRLGTCICLTELVVLAFLVFAAVIAHKNHTELAAPMEEWQSEYIGYSGVWHADENAVRTTDTIDVVRSPEMRLPRGTYTVTIQYAAEERQRCTAFSQNHRAYMETGHALLSKNQNLVSFAVKAKQDIPDFRVVVKYTGQGSFDIYSVSVSASTAGVKQKFVSLFFLFLFIDLFFFFGRAFGEHKNVLLALAGIVLLSSLPLLIEGTGYGHDIDFHLMRIEGVAKELRRGQIPVRLSSLWMEGYGYPVSVYYVDLLLYLPAVMRLSGFGIVDSYKTYVFVIQAGTAIIAYLCFQKIFRDSKIALLVCLAYMTAGYRMVDVYVRSAVGEYSAMMFFPVIGAAVYDIYREDPADWKSYRKHAIPLAVGMTGVLGTHMLSTEMVLVVLAFVALAFGRKTFRINTLRLYGLAVGISVVLNMYFLIPFFDYYVNVPVNISAKLADSVPQQIQYGGAYIAQYFSFFQDIFGDNRKNVSERFAMTPGLVLMSVFVIAVIFWMHKKADREMRILTVFSALILFVASNLFPWNSLAAHTKLGNLLAQVQFPWRYLGIAILFLALLLGSVLRKVSADEIYYGKGVAAVVAASIAMTCFFTSNFLDGTTSIYHVDTPELDTYAAGSFEYLRFWTDRKRLNHQIVSENMQQVQLLSRDGCYMELLCEGTETEGTIEVPMLNYKGYRVTDESGNVYEITDGADNVIRFTLPAGFSGKIEIDFKEPWYWRAGELTSLAAVLGILLSVWHSQRRDRL